MVLYSTKTLLPFYISLSFPSFILSRFINYEFLSLHVGQLVVKCTSHFLVGVFLTVSNNVDDKIQTEHILITDVSQRNEDSLICWYRSLRSSALGLSWYHEFIEHSPSDGRSKIPKITQTSPYYFGWSSKIERHLLYFQKLNLLRQPDTVAVEGVFTCDTGHGESTSVGIHYPSMFQVF